MQKIVTWLKNYWYYYKWRVLAIGFILIVLIFCAVQCATQEKYDVFFTYAGQDNIAPLIDDMRSAIRSSFTGADQKNSSGISIRDIIWVNSKLAKQYAEDDVYFNAYQNSENEKLLFTEAASGDSFIYILDAEQYEKLKANGLFTPLSDIFGNSVPKSAYDEYGIIFKQTEIAKFYPCFGELNGDLILCLRTKELSASLVNKLKGQSEYEKSYELHKKIFIDLVDFKVK